jgi:predicted lipid carrier protein YhbT
MRRWLGEQLIAADRSTAVHRLLRAALARAIAARFDPAACDGLHARFELVVRDPHGRADAHFAVEVDRGRCVVRSGRPPDVHARARIGFDDLVRLVSGTTTWPALFSTGRFELTGDPFLGLRLAALFRLPVVLEAS